MKTLQLVIALFLFASSQAYGSELKPTQLRCEYLDNPIGIDALSPRLSWRLDSDQRGQSQSAYRIRVASSLETLAAGEGDLWDSGKISSSETLHID